MKKYAWQRVIRDSDLDATAKAAAWALSTWMDRAGHAYPGKVALAKSASLGKRTADEAILRVEAAGLLRIKRSLGGRSPDGKGIANRYTATTPAILREEHKQGEHAGERVRGCPLCPAEPCSGVQGSPPSNPAHGAGIEPPKIAGERQPTLQLSAENPAVERRRTLQLAAGEEEVQKKKCEEASSSSLRYEEPRSSQQKPSAATTPGFEDIFDDLLKPVDPPPARAQPEAEPRSEEERKPEAGGCPQHRIWPSPWCPDCDALRERGAA